MACFYPVTAWQTDDGAIVFAERGRIRRELTLPCGQCVGCRLERSRQWAVRCMHESQMHRQSHFVTLTYADENLPHDWSLNYSHFQKFLKRARKRFGPFRFFMCGEYGEENYRPHYHACLFGLSLSDLYPWRTSGSGCDTFRSSALEAVWTAGAVEVGEVTFESAAYVARYCVKKVTGSRAAEHYESVDAYTGEIYNRTPEFARMSLKPGIGALWFDKFHKEVFPRDRVVVRGRETKPPRYYMDLLKRQDNYNSDFVEHTRQVKARELDPAECSPERLAVREEVTKARLSFKKRTL